MPPKKILVCPLNWGLGHATRCGPIINSFLKQGAEVFLASDGIALEFLKKEFSVLTSFQLPAYNVQYPQSGSMTIAMLLQSPKIFSAIKKEHKEIEKIIQDNNIDDHKRRMATFATNTYNYTSIKYKIHSMIKS